MTLYVSDLDGTLLNNQQRISEKTGKTLCRLIEQGLNFTIATARSWESARSLIEPLQLKLPVILNNGACLLDPASESFISTLSMNHDLTGSLAEDMAAAGVNTFVFSDLPERTVYHGPVSNDGEKHYHDARLACGDRRFTQADKLPQGDFGAIAFISIGYKKVLEPLKEKLEQKHKAHFHLSTDIYSDYAWLEIQHADVNKGSAVLNLGKALGMDKTVCFGDHLNDMSMFRVCDEGFAMANARDELKALATDTIGSNENDGVAEYLSGIF